MPAWNRRQLLKRYCSKQFNAFMTNDETRLELPAQPLLSRSRISSRVEKFKKEIITLNKQSSISFITKKHSVTRKYDAHAFVWKTSAKKVKEAVRWGIITTDSVTGKVISNLGRYRLVAHERIMKGLISNTHAAKLALLDIYQDRFELLQPLESLANKKNSYADFERILSDYIFQLKVMKLGIAEKAKLSQLETLSPGVTKKIERDIERDIRRAEDYLTMLKKHAPKLRAFAYAAGSKSILTFVRRQMNRNLYEMQGINQDMTFSKTHPAFSATRGEMNDCIIDAMKENDEFSPDLSNAVLPAHHGQFGEDDEIVSYQFGLKGESPEGWRAAITAISFIEGCDKIDLSDPEKPAVKNKFGIAKLKVIASATWQSAVSVKEFFRGLGAAIVNMFKSVAVSVRPRESKPWGDDFQLQTADLCRRAKPNHPFWYYPVELAKEIYCGIKNIFKGLKDSGKKLVVDMPIDVVNDWHSTSELPALHTVIEKANKKIQEINSEEEDSLHLLMKEINANPKLQAKLKKPFDLFTTPKTGPRLAEVEYHLTAGEQNDLLTACARGTNEFVGLFTHNIYAKDPYAGLIFTVTYAFGGLAVLLPGAMSFLGLPYINLSQLLGSSTSAGVLGQIIGSGSTQAYLSAMAWNTVIDGSKSWIAKGVKEFSNDPLRFVIGIAAVYAIGSVMTDGLFGLRISVINDFFEEELGSIKELGQLPVGAKVLGIVHHAFSHQHNDPFKGVDLTSIPKNELNSEEFAKKYEREIHQFYLIMWLASHHEDVLKLDIKTRHAIERQINHYFSAKDAASLRKIIYPEKERSIAYQMFAIPLSYVPALLRLLVSPVLSIIAKLCHKPNPTAPMKISGMALAEKMRRDLLRLVVAGKEIARFFFTLTAAVVKMLFNVTTLLFARVAGLCGYHPSHGIHRFMAKVHGFFNRIAEKLNPVRALRTTAIPHPNHTVNKMAAVYKEILKQGPNRETTASSIVHDESLTSSSQESSSSEESSLSEEVSSSEETSSSSNDAEFSDSSSSHHLRDEGPQVLSM